MRFEIFDMNGKSYSKEGKFGGDVISWDDDSAEIRSIILDRGIITNPTGINMATLDKDTIIILVKKSNKQIYLAKRIL